MRRFNYVGVAIARSLTADIVDRRVSSACARVQFYTRRPLPIPSLIANTADDPGVESVEGGEMRVPQRSVQVAASAVGTDEFRREEINVSNACLP